MRSITYKLFLASAFIAATFTSDAANAQTTLNVPFNFNVGRSLVPAGALGWTCHSEEYTD